MATDGQGYSSTFDATTMPSPDWLKSIDAVYTLFEDEAIAQQVPELASKVKKAVQLCEEVIQDVGWEHCALSFNGGKDCKLIRPRTEGVTSISKQET